MSLAIKKLSLFIVAFATALTLTVALDVGQAEASSKRKVNPNFTSRKCDSRHYTCISSGNNHFNMYRVQYQSPYYGNWSSWVGRYAN